MKWMFDLENDAAAKFMSWNRNRCLAILHARAIVVKARHEPSRHLG